MWSTQDEVRFINGIGNHRSPRALVPPEEKLEYLKRYKEGLDLRVVWGHINQQEVRRYVDSRISYYEKLIQNPSPKL